MTDEIVFLLSKKVVQLTKVVYNLNTLNESKDLEVDKVCDVYEKEMDAVVSQANMRIQSLLDLQKNSISVEQCKAQVNTLAKKYEDEKREAVRKLAGVEKSAAEKFEALKLQTDKTIKTLASEQKKCAATLTQAMKKVEESDKKERAFKQELAKLKSEYEAKIETLTNESNDKVAKLTQKFKTERQQQELKIKELESAMSSLNDQKTKAENELSVSNSKLQNSVSELKKLKEMNQNLETELRSLKETLDGYKAKLESETNKVPSYELDNAKRKIEDLGNELAVLRNTYNVLNVEHGKLVNDSLVDKGKLSKISAEYESFKNQYDTDVQEYKNRIAELQKQLNSNSQLLVDTTSLYSKLQQEHNSIMKEYEQLKTVDDSRKRMAAMIEERDETIRQLSDELAKFKSNSSLMNEDVKRTEKELDSLRKKYAESLTQIDLMKDELLKKQALIDQYVKQLANGNVNMQRREEDFNLLKQENEKYNTKIRELLIQITDLKEENGKIKELLSISQSEKMDNESNKNKLELELAKLKEQYDKVSNENTTLKVDNNTKDKTISKLSQELDDITRQFQKLKEELEKTKSSLSAQLAKINGEYEEIKSKYNELLEINEQTKTELEFSKKQLNSVRNELDILNNKLQTQQHLASNSSSELKKYIDENNLLKMQIQNKTAEVARLKESEVSLRNQIAELEKLFKEASSRVGELTYNNETLKSQLEKSNDLVKELSQDKDKLILRCQEQDREIHSVNERLKQIMDSNSDQLKTSIEIARGEEREKCRREKEEEMRRLKEEHERQLSILRKEFVDEMSEYKKRLDAARDEMARTIEELKKGIKEQQEALQDERDINESLNREIAKLRAESQMMEEEVEKGKRLIGERDEALDRAHEMLKEMEAQIFRANEENRGAYEALERKHAFDMDTMQRKLREDQREQQREYEEKIQTLLMTIKEHEGEIDQWRSKYDNRPSRKEDVAVISQLKSELDRSLRDCEEMKRLMMQYKMELRAREEMYNERFGRAPKIAGTGASGVPQINSLLAKARGTNNRNKQLGGIGGVGGGSGTLDLSPTSILHKDSLTSASHSNMFVQQQQPQAPGQGTAQGQSLIQQQQAPGVPPITGLGKRVDSDRTQPQSHGARAGHSEKKPPSRGLSSARLTRLNDAPPL